MIKLIAIDIDGTLLNSHKQLTPKVQQAIEKAQSQDIKVVICTGRPYASAKPVADSLNFTDDDYMIVFNGGQIRKATTGQLLSEWTLDMDDLQVWRKETDRLTLPLNVIDSEWVYEPTDYPENYPSLYVSGGVTSAPAIITDYKEFEPDHLFNKFIICTEANYLAQQAALIQSAYRQKYQLTQSHPYLLEIARTGVHKGSSLAWLGNHIGIRLEDMMVIGDENNDRTMIEMAGMGVAMGNATDEIKAIADYITESNDQDGVAQAINHFIK